MLELWQIHSYEFCFVYVFIYFCKSKLSYRFEKVYKRTQTFCFVNLNCLKRIENVQTQMDVLFSKFSQKSEKVQTCTDKTFPNQRIVDSWFSSWWICGLRGNRDTCCQNRRKLFNIKPRMSKFLLFYQTHLFSALIMTWDVIGCSCRQHIYMQHNWSL